MAASEPIQTSVAALNIGTFYPGETTVRSITLFTQEPELMTTTPTINWAHQHSWGQIDISKNDGTVTIYIQVVSSGLPLSRYTDILVVTWGSHTLNVPVRFGVTRNPEAFVPVANRHINLLPYLQTGLKIAFLFGAVSIGLMSLIILSVILLNHPTTKPTQQPAQIMPTPTLITLVITPPTTTTQQIAPSPVQPTTTPYPTQVPTDAVFVPEYTETPYAWHQVLCDQSLPIRVQVNANAWISYVDNSSVSFYLRSGPGLNYGTKTSLVSGTQVFVTSGPQCGNGMTWWMVSTYGSPYSSGWIAESQGSVYHLEPSN